MNAARAELGAEPRVDRPPLSGTAHAVAGEVPTANLPTAPGQAQTAVIGQDGSLRTVSWDATDDPLRWRTEVPPE